MRYCTTAGGELHKRVVQDICWMERITGCKKQEYTPDSTMKPFLVFVVILLLVLPFQQGAGAWSAPADSSTATTNRRQLFRQIPATAAAAAFLLGKKEPAFAATEETTMYTDPTCQFSIQVPSTWETSIQELPDRRKLALYLEPNSNKKTLMFMAFTPVRDDYTSLGSFGSIDQVAQATILPKGELAGQSENSSEMLSADSKKNAYFFDYTQTITGQPKTHFRTIFALKTGATGGAGAVLVSITAQTPESEYAQWKPLFDSIMDSYKPS